MMLQCPPKETRIQKVTGKETDVAAAVAGGVVEREDLNREVLGHREREGLSSSMVGTVIREAGDVDLMTAIGLVCQFPQR